MLKLSCLCGQVRIEIPKRPDFINECNCTLCRKSGARWAYFHPSEVSVEGATKGYSREDKEDPPAERECPENGGMTTREVRSVGSKADRGNGDAMGVAVDDDGG
jgi:hypothetical protein